MHEHVEAAVNALRSLGFRDVTARHHESYRVRYIARHGKEPPEQPNQVWEWRTKDGRFVQVIVNNKTGVCITSLDVPGDCLGDVLRAAGVGDAE